MIELFVIMVLSSSHPYIFEPGKSYYTKESCVNRIKTIGNEDNKYADRMACVSVYKPKY